MPDIIYLSADRFNRRQNNSVLQNDSLGDSIAMALASVYIRDPYETIVAYVEDNLGTPVITADDDDDDD